MRNDWTDAGLTTIPDAIKFKGKLFFAHETNMNGQMFGQLETITGTGVKVNINEILIRFDAARKYDFDDAVDEFEQYFKENPNLDDSLEYFDCDSVSQVAEDDSMAKYRNGDYKLEKKPVKKAVEVKKLHVYPSGYDMKRIFNPQRSKF